MSEKKPFDAAINSLKQTQHVQHGLWPNEHGVDEYRAAIRVLEEWPKWKPLIEAARKVDKKKDLEEFQRFMCRWGGMISSEQESYERIRALLESLAPKEEKQ